MVDESIIGYLNRLIKRLESGRYTDISCGESIGTKDATKPTDTVRRFDSDGNHTVVLKFREKST
jgi:hypothetical protein